MAAAVNENFAVNPKPLSAIRETADVMEKRPILHQYP